MILTKNQFFILLFAIILVPFLANRIIWLAKSKLADGVMIFTGHGDLGSALGISTYSVIEFKADKKSIVFHSNNLRLKAGQIVPLRYQINNPSDAAENNFLGIWIETIAYAMFPILILVVLFLMPERLDPIIPKKSKIILGKKPFIQMLRQ